MKSLKYKTFATLLFTACSFSSFAENSSESLSNINPEVDKLFKAFTSETPGCAVAVDKDGQIDHLAAYGMGDFEQNIELKPQSVFYAASVSKQVVAMAALLMEREGLIDLDEDIHTYIPEFQDYGNKLTIRQVLHHTSGIRDYFGLFWLAGTLDGMVISADKIMDILSRQKSLNFSPGEKWAYSNSAYFLISQISERVAGKTLDEYSQEKIFGPLKMTSSKFQHNHRRPISNKAHGHSLQDNGEWFIANSTLDVVGSGGMYTTVEDLIKWDRNFYDNQLGTGQDMIEEMETSGVLNNGEATEYGLALSLKPYRGLTRRSHGGSLTGYRAFLQRFPEQRFSVALLCNSSEVNSAELATAVSDVYLANIYSEPAVLSQSTPEEKAHVPLPDTQSLEDFEGDFYNNEVDNTIKVAAVKDGITLSIDDDLVLRFVGNDTFEGQWGSQFNFQRDSDGNITGFTFNTSRVMGVHFVKQ
ncbi:serine hydrolase [Glaciecola petra]|uniref:Serine hydrolase n=1 Tax=Glaciecola petra TaxID=3075602 RepID=A0ABU2ZUR2_9ALTE|nr:serine hydrolase [Aestuariibacter sp. P117]MDT0596382.1 serine hydrolase [Aestuariibacter sp. P117]